MALSLYGKRDIALMCCLNFNFNLNLNQSVSHDWHRICIENVVLRWLSHWNSNLSLNVNLVEVWKRELHFLCIENMLCYEFVLETKCGCAFYFELEV